MATLNTRNPTLADFVARLNGDNEIETDIVEIMNQTNEMLTDITFQEANGYTEHLTTVRSGLPEPAWREMNYGVQPSKSTTVQIKDSIGMLSALSEVDKKLAQINGMDRAWRVSEDAPFIEAMGQEIQKAIIYGNDKTGKEQIFGLSARYSTGKKKAAANAKNVFNAGGTAATSGETGLGSIWLLCWSPSTLFCTFPKGSRAGLQTNDLGEYLTTDANGGKYLCLGTEYDWDIGLVLRDWRYCARIANVPLADLDKTVDNGGVDILRLMMKAKNQLPSLKAGRMAFYCSREVRNALEAQAMDRKNVLLNLAEVTKDNTVLTYAGIPIRIVDALHFNEKQVQFD